MLTFDGLLTDVRDSNHTKSCSGRIFLKIAEINKWQLFEYVQTRDILRTELSVKEAYLGHKLQGIRGLFAEASSRREVL